MANKINEVLERVKDWPESAQAELAEIALEMEATLRGGSYSATTEELRAIDEAEGSGVASDAAVDTAFASFRQA